MTFDKLAMDLSKTTFHFNLMGFFSTKPGFSAQKRCIVVWTCGFLVTAWDVNNNWLNWLINHSRTNGCMLSFCMMILQKEFLHESSHSWLTSRLHFCAPKGQKAADFSQLKTNPKTI